MVKLGNHSSAININTSCWSEYPMQEECVVGVTWEAVVVVVVGGAFNWSECQR